MLRSIDGICLAVLLAGAGCGKQGTTAPLPAGTTHADAPEHPCTWFTADEIGERLGARVGAGRIAGPLGTACQWDGIGDAATFVQIQVVRDVSFWSMPEPRPEVAMLTGVGRAAYVEPAVGGFKAAGLLERAFVQVFVGGPTANRAIAERLLVDTLGRVR